MLTIDISQRLEQFLDIDSNEMSLLATQAAIAVGSQVIAQIRELAESNLNTSKDAYLNGLSMEASDRGCIIRLNGALANAIEYGAPSFDMKPGFAASGKVKRGKKGWYLTIPIAANMSAIESQPQDEVTTLFEKIVQSVSKVASKIVNVIIPVARKPLQDIPSTNKSTQGPINFRKVGVNSNEMSWIHPGWQAKNLLNQALDRVDVDNIVDTIVLTYLSGKYDNPTD